MTLKLFWQDPYTKEFDAKVMDIQGDKVILDQSAFFAESGGQMADHGTLNDVKVLDTKYNEDKSIIYHIVEDPSKFAKDQQVHGKIDWQRRYKTMQHHSAIHVMYFVFERLYGAQKIIGSQVRHDSSRMDYEFFEKIDIEKIKEQVNAILKQNLDITTSGSSEDENKRIWTCEDMVMPCGGTHVKNTSEIPQVRIKRKSLSSQGQRLYCIVE